MGKHNMENIPETYQEEYLRNYNQDDISYPEYDEDENNEDI